MAEIDFGIKVGEIKLENQLFKCGVHRRQPTRPSWRQPPVYNETCLTNQLALKFEANLNNYVQILMFIKHQYRDNGWAKIIYLRTSYTSLTTKS